MKHDDDDDDDDDDERDSSSDVPQVSMGNSSAYQKNQPKKLASVCWIHMETIPIL